MRYTIILFILIILLSTHNVMGQDSETSIREYTAYGLSGNDSRGDEFFNINLTPYSLDNDVDKSKSKTLLIGTLSCGFEGGSNSICSIDVTIGGHSIDFLGDTCGGFAPLLHATGGDLIEESASRGAGHSRAVCSIPYQEGVKNVSIDYEETQITEAQWSLEIIQIEVYNQTISESSLPPAIESGAFIRDSLEYTLSINNTHQEGVITNSTLTRNIPQRNLDSVLLRNESDSTLLIHYYTSAVASPGNSNAEFNITVNGNSLVNPCVLIVSGEVQGTAKGGTLSCRLQDYQDGLTEIEVAVSDPDNIIQSVSFSTEIRQTETRLVPLMPETITLEPFASILPLLIFGLLITAAEWKEDPLYYILSGILGLLITINLPTFLPEYTRIFLIAVSLYLVLRAYLSYSDARMNTDVIDET